MLGKLLTLAAAVTGAVAQTTVVAPPGSTIIIIATNAGGGASWQNVNPPMAGTPASPQTHQVDVGGENLIYSPDSITAAMGDYVQFNFLSQNHTVTQSSFATPCVNAKMFDSGFMPNMNNGTNPPPAMKMQVMTTTPQWFYCKQKTPTVHCGKGMTFSINPTADKTQAMFKSLAMQQNGTATAGAPPSGTTAAAPPPASSAAAAAPAPPSPSVASGTGSTDPSGSCQCSCLCGVAEFPMAAQQGMGSFGGMSGALPASMGVQGV